MVNVSAKIAAHPFAFCCLDDFQGRARAGNNRRRRRRRENKASGAIDQKFYQRTGAGDKAAAASERFAESTHLNFNPLNESQMSSQSFSSWPNHTGGLSFVEKKIRSMFVLEFDQLTQRGVIAVHAEQRFCNDPNFRVWVVQMGPLQHCAEPRQIVVWKNSQLSSREPSAVDKAGVG